MAFSEPSVVCVLHVELLFTNEYHGRTAIVWGSGGGGGSPDSLLLCRSFTAGLSSRARNLGDILSRCPCDRCSGEPFRCTYDGNVAANTTPRGERATVVVSCVIIVLDCSAVDYFTVQHPLVPAFCTVLSLWENFFYFSYEGFLRATTLLFPGPSSLYCALASLPWSQHSKSRVHCWCRSIVRLAFPVVTLSYEPNSQTPAELHKPHFSSGISFPRCFVLVKDQKVPAA